MKAYKVELLIVDYDGIGEQGIFDAIEETRYPNRCIAPSVMSIKSADIGEWHDDHLLNKRDTEYLAYRRLFLE